MAVIINRGQRTYTITGLDGTKKSLGPGGSLEVSDAMAKTMTRYHDIVDAAQAVPQNAAELARLKSENQRLKEEQSTLRESTPAPRIEEPKEASSKAKAKKAGAKKRGK